MKSQFVTEMETLSMDGKVNVAMNREMNVVLHGKAKVEWMHIKNLITTPIKAYGKYISKMMGVDFTRGEIWRILNVQFALVAIILPVVDSLLYTGVVTCWFAVAVYQCKELNKKVMAADDVDEEDRELED